MKSILIVVSIIFMGLISYPSQALQTEKKQGDKILGLWQTELKDAKIQVYRVGDVYYGKIIWLKHMDVPQDVLWFDNLNPDPKLRTRTRENIVAMTGMIHIGDNKYRKGLIYYPTNGKTYSCCATMVDDNSLNLRPYLGLRFLGYTIPFTRVN
jgi:uncharacterized protein (DUF2147 family)